MKYFRALAVFFCVASPAAFAQLTQDQKVSDFMQLVGIYAKNYAPYEWKRDVIGFDLYKVTPWLDQVKTSKTDLDFYDICIRYVASLQDSHDEFTLPSDFEAYLPFTVDVYDGKVLIDYIDRSSLPARSFPFQIGDEIVSIDGKSAQDWITELAPYAVNGSANPVSRQRLAANLMIDRYQGWYTYAPMISENATVVVAQENGGTQSYTMPWIAYGTPLLKVGPVPDPITASRASMGRRPPVNRMHTPPGVLRDRARATRWGAWTGAPAARVVEEVPAYMQVWKDLQTMEKADTGGSISPFGSIAPFFNPPPGTKIRLGAGANDQFLSGTIPVGGHTVGFIRIPTMSPAGGTTLALNQFATEIVYFQQNTDALVIDVMENGGGSLCYIENLAQFLIPTPFRSFAYNIRATQFWLEVFSSSLYNTVLSGGPSWLADIYSAFLKETQQAAAENRGLTGDLPICQVGFSSIQPFTDSKGNVLAYTKPILVLTDNFSLSAAEAFSMVLQDNGRATIFGTRTDGGGGNPGSYNATTYSEGSTRATRTFVTRGKTVQTPGFPPSRYLENTGVYPDIVEDAMTKENLMTGGAPFIADVMTAITNLIQGK